MSKPVMIEDNEWLYKGCFIQKCSHPLLQGDFSVFKNNEAQDRINRASTFREAKRLCEENICEENFLTF